MADNKQIFRKVSLERLSSPEQLDMLMRVTSRKGWVALLALCGLAVVAIAWGIVGTVPSKVSGSCILIRPGGLSDIVAPGSGMVSDISVDVGDTVREGQIIARIENSDALEQIRATETKLDELKAQDKKLKAFDTLSEQQQTAYLRDLNSTLNDRIHTAEEQLHTLEAKIQSQAKLLEEGLITKQTLFATKLEFDNVKQSIEESRAAILKNGEARTEQRKQIQNELASLGIQISEVSRSLASQTYVAKQFSQISSPYDGRVVEIRASENTQINAGMPILTIEQTGKSVNVLEARIYVAPLDGKKVKTDMDVQISPSTVKPEEFGVMLGKVRTVAAFPSTAQGMMRILNNAQLVQELSAGAPPISVRANLVPSADTVSGYKWSSPKGPGIKIESGTLCTATITVKKQRPISLVIPMLRGLLGTEQ